MKRTLMLGIAFMLSVVVYSQYYYLPHFNAGQNPGSLNADPEYPLGGGMAAGWTQVLAGSQATPAWSTSQVIPFDFLFNGDTVIQYFVSSSGVLTFEGTVGAAPSSSNLAIPHASIPDKSICIWGLAGSGSNDIIVSKTFGTAPNRQHWVHFSSYNYGGGVATDWVYWSIIIEETTNKIYILDQRTNVAAVSLTLGIQFNNSTAISVSGSPNVSSLASTDPTAADNTYYEFIPGQQPDYDCATLNSTISNYLSLTSAPFSIQANVMNYGALNVQSLDLSYAVNNGTPVTSNITGLNILPFANTLLSSSIPWSPSLPGAYDLKLWVSSINGNPDQNNTNDTFMVSVMVFDTIITKKVLVEQATGTWCGYCPDGSVILSQILQSNGGKAIGVALHNGASNPMAFADGNTVNSAYAQGYPNGYVDRVLFSDQTAVGMSRSVWAAKTTQRLNAIVPVAVEAQTTYTPSGKVITIDMSAKFFSDATGEYRVNAFIVEDSVTGGSAYNQTNYYHETAGHPYYGAGNPIVGYTHRHVVRAMLGGPWGTSGVIPTTINKNDVFNKQYTYNVPAGVNPNRLSVVVLVQKYSATVNDRPILNVEEYKLGIIDGIEEMNLNGDLLSLYPNPAAMVTNLDFMVVNPCDVSVEVFNMLGEKLMVQQLGFMPAGEHHHQMDVSNLAQGVYVMKVNFGGSVSTQKFTVQ